MLAKFEQSVYYTIWSLNAIYNIILLRKEISTRIQHKKSSNNKTRLFQSKSLSYFSLSTLIFATLWPIANLMQRINCVCEFATQITFIIAACTVLSFNYYQLSRLFYCFSSSKAHSKKGYPTYVFTILYTIGALLMLWTSISIWFLVSASHNHHSHTSFGIPPCIVTYSQYYNLDVLCSTIAYYMETGCILSLYVHKILQFKRIAVRIKTNDENALKITERIRFILNKVFVLTLTAEISITLFTVIAAIRQTMDSPVYMVVLQKICSSIASIWMSTSMYLMMEHNKDDYFWFIEKLNWIDENTKICCCFRGFINNAREHNQDSTDEGLRDGEADDDEDEEPDEQGGGDGYGERYETDMETNTNMYEVVRIEMEAYESTITRTNM